MSGSKKSEILRNLIDFIKKEGGISVSVASELFGISEVTARRYLNEISQMESLPLRRVRGGIVLETGKGSIEFMFDTKLSINENEKKRIAKRAAEFVDDGDSILIDSGTTAFYLARYLKGKRGLKVITVDVKVAEELAKNPDFETYVVGGLVRPGYFSLGGDLAVEILRRFKVEKTFLTADAVDPDHGITNSSMFEMQVKREIVGAGKKVILIADHTKIGKIAFVKVVDFEKIDIFITSNGAPKDMITRIMEKGVEVIVV
ncbi:MAG: DeoR/GlpR transcriptional regulator [Thermotoga sp.]|nr:MAG: DeoR/GlpR transcriptional regulator [Thermotoga sp.]